jgi:hypothetical protein
MNAMSAMLVKCNLKFELDARDQVMSELPVENRVVYADSRNEASNLLYNIESSGKDYA